MSATEAYSTGEEEILPAEAPQVPTFVQFSATAPSVPDNIFMGTVQGVL